MVHVLLRALLAAGITACVVAAVAVGYLSLVPLPECRSSQPAPREKRSVGNPPPLVVDIDRSELD